VMTREIAEVFDDRAYPGGLTYSGHPLGAALGVATFEVFRRDRVLEHVRELESTVVVPALEKMAAEHPSIGEFRGRGLFYALELVKDKETREPLVPFNAGGAAAAPMAEVKKACLDGGLFPMVSANRVHIAPPLVISAADLTKGLAVIDAALDQADKYAAR
jgi:taurine---2-oxoglutarate transaminase